MRAINSLIILSIPAMAVACVLYGCAATADSPEKPAKTTRSTIGHGQSGQPAAGVNPVSGPAPVIITSVGQGGVNAPATVVDARPAAMVNGKAVSWGDLKPILNEAAGAEALQEVILDLKIEQALTSAGIVIDDDAMAAERRNLLESLNADSNMALRLLDELRNRQHLGKVRFNALMRRNAGLRALVRNQVKVNDASVETMHEMLHGAKRQARLMVLTDLASAEGAINLVKSGGSFADVAVEMSTDSSAPRGGLLEPISQADPAYPEALRQSLFSMNIGEMSGPILLDGKYAVIMLVKRIAPDQVTLAEAKPTLERLVRMNQERILMDQLARTMLSDVSVTIFDESLNESWSRRGRPGS